MLKSIHFVRARVRASGVVGSDNRLHKHRRFMVNNGANEYDRRFHVVLYDFLLHHLWLCSAVLYTFRLDGVLHFFFNGCFYVLLLIFQK